MKVGGTKWNLLDSKTGTAAMPLPNDFNEVLGLVRVYGTVVEIPILIPKEELSNTPLYFRGGYYIGTNSYLAVSINATLSSISLGYVGNTGSEATSNSTITVYYR